MEDKPQIYGTQFRNEGSGWEPFPIEDPEHVDERRTSVGLDTFAEKKKPKSKSGENKKDADTKTEPESTQEDDDLPVMDEPVTA